jgi:hypothetical protein
VRAKDTMRARLDDISPAARSRVRTLHALGNDVLRQARGTGPLIDEWEMRRRVEALVPVKPRANTDVYAPYLEALSEVRLGLVDPQSSRRAETMLRGSPRCSTSIGRSSRPTA